VKVKHLLIVEPDPAFRTLLEDLRTLTRVNPRTTFRAGRSAGRVDPGLTYLKKAGTVGEKGQGLERGPKTAATGGVGWADRPSIVAPLPGLPARNNARVARNNSHSRSRSSILGRGASCDDRPNSAVRAMAGNAPRHPWHLRQSW
jgi:hypothetical protein